jgi:hypothetical protein
MTRPSLSNSLLSKLMPNSTPLSGNLENTALPKFPLVRFVFLSSAVHQLQTQWTYPSACNICLSSHGDSIPAMSVLISPMCRVVGLYLDINSINSPDLYLGRIPFTFHDACDMTSGISVCSIPALFCAALIVVVSTHWTCPYAGLHSFWTLFVLLLSAFIASTVSCHLLALIGVRLRYLAAFSCHSPSVF